jgi:HAD superfamily hydrolase (TIGR01459 family)
MSMAIPIGGLATLSSRYEVLFCDVWGVIHDGRHWFRSACEALSRWRAERGPVILISNSPRPASDVEAQLNTLGVPSSAWSAIVTSGDATRQLLGERAPGPAFRIGPERDARLYEGLNLEFAPIGEAVFIVCSGPEDDEVETPEDYRDCLAAGLGRGLEMVCANPDKVVQRGDRLIYCGGALADLYLQMGGRVVMAGKPYAPIYDLCFARAHALVGRHIAPSEILAIGDSVETDLRGAEEQGLDALFIASGVNDPSAIGPDRRPIVAEIDALLVSHATSAAFVMVDLAW